MTKEDESAIVEIFQTTHQETPHPNLQLLYKDAFGSLANVYVCHSWDYKYIDFIQLLEDYTSERSKHETAPLCFWIDIFVFNQHASLQMTYNWFKESFEKAIDEIGTTVVLFDDWESPALLTRTWCLYEIYLTVKLESKMKFQLKVSAMDAFNKRIRDDIDFFLPPYCHVDIQASKATEVYDQAVLLSEFGTKSYGSLEGIESKLNDVALNWIVDNAVYLYFQNKSNQDKDSDAYVAYPVEAVKRLGEILSYVRKYTEAEQMFKHVLRVHEAEYGALHVLTTDSLKNIAVTKYHQGNTDEAEQLYLKIIGNYTALVGENDDKTIKTMIELANLRKNCGKIKEAERTYQQVLVACKVTFGAEHPNTMSAINNIAHLMTTQDRLGEAEKMYQKALEGYTKLYGAEHHITCDVAYNYGLLVERRGRVSHATQLYRKSYLGLASSVGEDHQATNEVKKALIAASIKEKKAKKDNECVVS